MTKEEVLNYVMTTPNNSNPNVLMPMLGSLVDSNGVPPEVENAVETGGLGWTSEEPVAINITWDGDTEGRESAGDGAYKVSDEPISKEDIIGATVSFVAQSDTESIIITEDNIESYESFPFYNIELEDNDTLICVVTENFEEIHKGVYFFSKENGDYVSSLTKEASIKEVIHQIDSKYILDLPFKITLTPIGHEGAFWTCSVDKTVEEVSQAILDGRIIIVASINIQGYTFCKIAETSLFYDGDIYFGFRNSGTEERTSGGDMYLEYDSSSSEWIAKIAQPL